MLISPTEFAKRANRTYFTILKAIRAGRLPAVKQKPKPTSLYMIDDSLLSMFKEKATWKNS